MLRKHRILIILIVIVGGLLRFLLEGFKNEMAKEEKQKELTKELVDILRQVYDAVEFSRILIESHKTAKTYGERIRIRIIPAKISLYHVKRGIYDREEFVSSMTVINDTVIF